MKKTYSNVSKYLILIAFSVFVMVSNLSTISFAAATKVTNLTQVNSTEKSIKISYDAPLGAKKFTIYVSEYNTFPIGATVTLNTTSSKNISITGLNSNRTYFVKVIPISPTNVEYDFSDTITCVTEPEDVEDVKHTESTVSSITITWSAPITGAQSYNIYYKPSSTYTSEIYAGTTSATTYTINNLTDDTKYNVYVYPVRKSSEGYEAVGDKDYTTYLPTVANADKLAQYELYKWKPDSANASIRFLNNQEHQSGIELEISNLSGKKIKTINLSKNASSGNIISNKIKNKGFQYRLRYYVTTDTKNCYGPYSKMKVVIPYAKTTVSKNSNTSLKIKWKKIEGAASYSVYVSKKNSSSFKKVATVKSTSYVLKNTKKAQNYYIYVKANKVKVGKKKYSSTKPERLNIKKIWYHSTKFNSLNLVVSE